MHRDMQDSETVIPVLRLRMAVDSLIAVARSEDSSDAPAFHTLRSALLVATTYYVGSQIGFLLTPADAPISFFWPPNAILLAILLLTPRRIWWVLVVAVFPAHFLIQLRAGVPALSALGWFIGNVGEALLGATFIRHFQKEKELLFTSVPGVVTFWVSGVLLAPLLTSFLDAGSTVLTGLGTGYWTLWVDRLTSNMIANLTVVPTIVTFATGGVQWFRKASRAQYAEAAVLAAGTVGVSYLVFAGRNLFDHGSAFLCAPLPFLIWAAVRFGPAGFSFTMMEVTLISVWSALHGRGIFEYSSMPSRTVSVHILLGLFVLPLMLMAAAIAERRRSEEATKSARGMLIYAQEQEYHRIARQLHTDIAGQLTLVGARFDELRASFHANARPPLDKLYDQVFDALNAILDLSHKMHPFGVEYLGLTRALAKLCRDIGAESGITVKSLVEEGPLELPLDVSLRIFRVAQLALQSIVDHRAKTASVELALNTERALLRITDDGDGTELDGRETLKLAYMREQTLSLGGTFKAISAPRKGMVIECSVPIAKVSVAGYS